MSPSPLPALLPLLLTLLLVGATPAHALEPTVDWTLSGAYFPAGAETTIRAGARQPLWDRPGNPLLESTYVQAGGLVMITPAFTRVGVEAAFQPAAIFELRGRGGVVGYYDAFTAVLLFDEPDIIYDPDTRAARDRTHGSAAWASLEPTLRMKGGPVVFLGTSTLRWVHVWPGPTTDTGAYWLEPELGMLMERDDTSWDHNGLLAGELRRGEHLLYVGAYATFRQVFSTDDSIARVGPVVAWFLPGGQWSTYAIVQPYIDSRIYDQVMPPYVALRLAWSLNPG